MQINTDTARIIYPRGMEPQAQQVAAIVHRLSRETQPTVGQRLHKIDIVFQNQTTISNGYVQLAPFRSEFELTTDQNSFELGSLPWQKFLAIHEYRHVQQYNNYRVGLSKALYYLFGEGGQELANNISIPNWFWEGDAVYQETLVSRQGRGRLPFFFNGYRALWAAEKKYSWMKLRNGSLRDYTPDHYPVGYMLVAYGRNKYGEDFWRNLTHDAAAFNGLFYPLQKAVKKYAGISFQTLRTDALSYFRQQLNPDSSEGSPAVFAARQKHFVADEEFPQFIDSAHIIFMRSTYRNIPSFTIQNLRTGQDTHLRTRAVSLNNYFSYRNNRIVYAGYEPDVRWGWRDFSVLRLMDVRTGVERKISFRSKYFSPDISENGTHIVAVQENPDGSSCIHLLNSQTGDIEKILPNPDQLFFTYPKFISDSTLVSAVRNQKGEMALGLVQIQDGTLKYLTPFSMNPIGFLSVQRDTIFFSATRDNMDRIFAYVQDGLYMIRLPHSEATTGDYQMQALSGSFLWTTFTAVGYRILTGKTIQWEKIDPDQWNRSLVTQRISSLEKGPGDLLDHSDSGNYPTERYPYGLKLFNFHSWRPYLNDPDYSFSLVSENVLSSLQSEVFIGYNRNEGYKQLGTDATYAAWFPWINAGLSYIFDRNAFYRNHKVYWNEADAQIGWSIPLNLSKGRTFSNLQVGNNLFYSLRSYEGAYKDTFSLAGFTYGNLYADFTLQLQKGLQQIYPRFAQSIALSYTRAVSIANANQFLASGYWYLPGFTWVQSLVLAGAFQQRDRLNRGGFTNSFPFSRGYSSENFYQMTRMSVNYHFPLLYPDAGLANLVYFLRIRADLYYDHTLVTDPYDFAVQPRYRSFGMEIYFDTKWWNELPISFGIRYSRLLDPDYEGRGPNQWEFILPLSLLSK